MGEQGDLSVEVGVVRPKPVASHGDLQLLLVGCGRREGEVKRLQVETLQRALVEVRGDLLVVHCLGDGRAVRRSAARPVGVVCSSATVARLVHEPRE